MEFDRDTYLDRIGLETTPSPTEADFARLHRAQTVSIPFENLDIHLGRGISLAPERLFDKLVKHERGGYCFELNCLFGMALDAFGFERRPLLARVHLRGEPTGRTHMFNLVHLNGKDWIADPGFGIKQLLEPIPLELGRTESQEGLKCRLVDGGEFGTMAQHFEDGGWENWFSFDMEHVWPADIEMGNYFTSTNPAAFFTKARLAIRTGPFSRVTLLDFLLRRHAEGHVTETVLEPGRTYLESLDVNFGIVLDAPYNALKPVAGDRMES